MNDNENFYSIEQIKRGVLRTVDTIEVMEYSQDPFNPSFLIVNDARIEGRDALISCDRVRWHYDPDACHMLIYIGLTRKVDALLRRATLDGADGVFVQGLLVFVGHTIRRLGITPNGIAHFLFGMSVDADGANCMSCEQCTEEELANQQLDGFTVGYKVGK